MTTISIKNRLQTHWFFAVAALVLVTDLVVVLFNGWETPRILEAGLLFDIALLILLLYVFCYRSKGKKTIVRAFALVCLGIWVVGHIVPESNHYILEKVSPLRYVGLAVLVLLEVKVVVAIYKSAFSGHGSTQTDEEKITTESDMPDWVAKLMAWEASILRKLLNFFKK